MKKAYKGVFNYKDNIKKIYNNYLYIFHTDQRFNVFVWYNIIERGENMKKDFVITVQKEGSKLYIATETSCGVVSMISEEEQIYTCIKNYIQMYVNDEDNKYLLQKEVKKSGRNYE